MTKMIHTMLLDSFWMTSVRPNFFIPMWSKIATIMEIINPNTHNTTPTQQRKMPCAA